jgi:hypothetical protein
MFTHYLSFNKKMRQLDEKLQANKISYILLYMEVKVDYAMLEISTLPLKPIPVQACHGSK